MAVVLVDMFVIKRNLDQKLTSLCCGKNEKPGSLQTLFI